ncbi:membrane peptidoglycan carboxypeptidase [Propioniferax innocua]|uniref:Membrane peptidoglycan carboxypeptidase n=2 Tax=Propioniferax innocua TaxID=1753 RepID=A0A542ZD65_9ACTN|nr:membrane peptidoglycan carboxypeptidase [Propioniferax innocua]
MRQLLTRSRTLNAMSKSSLQAGSVVYRIASFGLVSLFAGILVAGLFIPGALAASAFSRNVADAMETLPADLEISAQSERSRVIMANGEELASFFEENRVYRPLSEISPVMQQAQVAIEDHRFFDHGAIDVKGTLRALVRNSTGDGGTQGGSSITQQFVKMAQVEAAKQRGDEEAIHEAQEKTVARKVQELRYAIALEKKYDKKWILEQYLNIAYYGDGAYGVQQAAWHYFGTHADQLNVEQSAMLAGLVQNPAATDPVHYPLIAVERRNVVLDRMASPDVGVISPAEAEEAAKKPFDPARVQPMPNGCVGTRYPFLCDYVRRELLTMPELGPTPEDRMNTVNRGGLRIETEIDPKTQDAAERAIADRISPRDPVIATMSMIQPGTGLIVALAQNRPEMGGDVGAGETYYNYSVGGRLSGEDMGGAEGYQAGSTFKTFTVAAALEQGISPSKSYNAADDMNFGGQTFENCEGAFTAPDYKVSNSTGRNGNMNMKMALAYSVNTYFIHLERDAGICNTAQMTQKLGVRLANEPQENFTKVHANNPSFTLGTPEVTPLSMAEAYATFAARGKHCNPVILKRVTNRAGDEVKVPGGKCEQVISEEVADQTNQLLQAVMNGTGSRARIPGGMPQGGKTGTIDDNQAVWFTGITPEMAGVSMIAIDKTHPYWGSENWYRGKPSLKGIQLPDSGTYLEGSGSGDAGAWIYAPAMAAALEGRPSTPFGKPASMPGDGAMNSLEPQPTQRNGG